MQHYRSARPSAILPPKGPPQHLPPSDTSASSNSSLVLSALTPTDIKVIDTIIQRASPTATTFLAIFKAYNDVLKEFGLDANEDVVYYRFLLKLGVVRGSNWGDRWKTVKNQLHNLTSGARDIARSHATDDDDATSTHSDTHVGEQTESDDQSPPFVTSTPQPRRVLTRPPTEKQGLEVLQPTPLPRKSQIVPRPVNRPRAQTTTVTPKAITPKLLPTPIRPPLTHESSRDPSPSTSTPPSYRTFATEKTPVPRPSAHPRTLAEFAEAAAKAGKLRVNLGDKDGKSAINAEETWKVLKMEQEADDFRRYMTMRRCWDVWLQGVQWVRNTNLQLDLARRDIKLRETMAIWKAGFRKYQDIRQRASNVAAVLACRKAFKVWQVRCHEQRRRAWQNEMRGKLNHMKASIAQRIVSTAFRKWKQSHQSICAIRTDSVRVLSKALERWRARLSRIRQLEERAENVAESYDQRRVSEILIAWNKQTMFRGMERAVLDLRSHNTLANAVRIWKRTCVLHQLAREQRQKWIIKRSIQKWRNAHARLQIMERRVNKYNARQGLILQRAVMRVWVAKERGARLDRAKRMLLGRDAIAVWKAKLSKVQQLYQLGERRVAQEEADLSARALAIWRAKRQRQQKQLVSAQQHRDRRLVSDSLLAWRVQLMVVIRMTRSARIARRFFVMKAALQSWRTITQARQRERKLDQFQLKFVKKAFVAWKFFTQRQRQQKFLCMAFEEKVSARIVSEALSFWIRRVVDRKVGELQVYEDFNLKLVRGAFEKWRAARERHKEEMSLMQSYHDIKREDLVRRVFIRWLTAMRRSVHNQIRLEKREADRTAQMQQQAWNLWREKYKERELAGMEKILKARTNMNVVFRAFRIWESKTLSVPAVRFASLQLKARVVKRWKQALPRAMKEREAREIYRQKLLANYLSAWKTKYRSKIALVSAVRARHLRLPAAAPSRPVFRTTPPNPPRASFSTAAAIRLSSPERPRFGVAPSEGPRVSPSRSASRDSVSPVREGAAAARASLLSRAYVRNALSGKDTASSPNLGRNGLVPKPKPATVVGLEERSHHDDETRSVQGSTRRAESEKGFGATKQPRASGNPLYAALDRDRLRLEIRGRRGLKDEEDR